MRVCSVTKSLSRGTARLVTAHLVTTPVGVHAGATSCMQIFRASLPHAAAGRWCLVSLCVDLPGQWWAKLEAADSARGQVVREAFFGPRRRGFFGRGLCRDLVLHVPQAAAGVRISVFSAGEACLSAPLLRLRVLSRREAAVRLLAGGWQLLPLALRGSTRGLLGRIRAILGQHAARRGEAPPYALWRDLFDQWGEAERAALSAAAPVAIEVVIVGTGHGDNLADGTAATLASIARQWRKPLPDVRMIREKSDWAGVSGEWVVVLRPGDVLVPHALACFGHAARLSPGKAAFCADFDMFGAGRERERPCLRPPPDPWSLESAYFGEGPWMFSFAACAASWKGLPADAAQARLALARGLRHSAIERVSLVLACCLPRSPDEIRERSPRTRRIMQTARHQTRISSGLGPSPAVSIIMPSACRSAHVLACLHHVLRATDYPDFEILLAVSQVDPADAVQAANLRRAGALPHVRVIDLEMPDFNYAEANNKAEKFARGSLLLLLNDDVVPLAADWLSKLVAYVCKTDGEQADIVGPRLLYGNGLVQHAGVIMGLANLCEHAFRLAPRWDRGPHGVAALCRQVCAVTAACMLVRRSLFESLCGLDEGFVIALNDVDFCLRAPAMGGKVVFAADVALYHFESLSLGRHYEGVRAGLEATEVRRLRARWEATIAADPFYHPCASLEVGREFQPGFPPRQSPLSWIAREPLALD